MEIKLADNSGSGVVMDRRIGIGGSDAAAACGLSPYKSAAQLYYEKAGLLEPDNLDAVEHVYWGTVLEDIVAREYAKRTGHKIRRVNQMRVHKEHPFMNCHVDRDVLNTDRILEVKTTNSWYHRTDEWGDPGTDEVPGDILIQCQHNMAVMAANWCDVPVLVAGQRFVVYTIRRDEELVAGLIDAETEFWRHVQEMTAPAMDYEHRDTAGLIKKLHPDIHGWIALDDDAQATHDRRVEVMAMLRELEKEKKSLTAQIQHMIGGAEEAYLPEGGGYVRSVVSRKGYAVQPNEYIGCRFKKSLRR